MMNFTKWTRFIKAICKPIELQIPLYKTGLMSYRNITKYSRNLGICNAFFYISILMLHLAFLNIFSIENALELILNGDSHSSSQTIIMH